MDNCQFCGETLDYEQICKTCNIEFEDRMNFSGYHFRFIEEIMCKRRFKTLPYPTKEERCEHCAFKLHVVEKHFNHKTRKPCKNLENFEFEACHLLPIGYCYDTRSVIFMFVKNTSRCKRFKKRKGEEKTQVVMIVL